MRQFLLQPQQNCEANALRLSPQVGGQPSSTSPAPLPAQVPGLVRMSKEALAEGKCVVIGLQSTGEARTVDVIAERGEELDDFVSGPKARPCFALIHILTFLPDSSILFPLAASFWSHTLLQLFGGRICLTHAS